jgi:hypothetical protein
MGLWHFAAFRGEPSDIARDLEELKDDSDATGLLQDADEAGDAAGDAAAEAFAFGGGAASGGPSSFADGRSSALNATVAGILRRWPVRSTTVGGTEESLDQIQVRLCLFACLCEFIVNTLTCAPSLLLRRSCLERYVRA